MQNIIILIQSITTFITILLSFDLMSAIKFKLTFHKLPVLLILYSLYMAALLFSVKYILDYILVGAFLGTISIILMSATKQPIKLMWIILLTFFWAQSLVLLTLILLFSKLEDLDDVCRP